MYAWVSERNINNRKRKEKIEKISKKDGEEIEKNVIMKMEDSRYNAKQGKATWKEKENKGRKRGRAKKGLERKEKKRKAREQKEREKRTKPKRREQKEGREEK